MRIVAWWAIRISCGVVTGVAVLMVVYSLAILISLLAGWVQPDFDTPPLPVALCVFVVSLVAMVVGFKAPTWLKIDRLL